ncbi:tyrosine phosphatase-like protein [Biscogniauxia mediterranea]|nr:tyrosine phosphatase-like protein [Biscogniauxia mediterranea]
MADTTRPAKKASASPVKNAYLVLYNAVSAGLWAVVLGRVVATNLAQGHEAVYPAVGQFCKWTQTLAGMEVLHSLFGIVRAPLITTFMQVFSRYALVWGIVDAFPGLAVSSPAYSTMLAAWATTEVVRYSYFALGLSGLQPAALHWLRYHAFFVLYPVGISSEAWLIWSAAAGPAKHCAYPAYSTLLYAFVALVYPPASYILYTHMMAQRRKVLKAAKAKNEKATQ